MKTLFAAALLAAPLFAVQSVDARDTGTINQVGPDQAAQNFYLHPAHFYWSSKSPNANGQHPAVLVKRGDTPTAVPIAMPTHPALMPHQPVVLAKARAQD